jgi:hypothetical protein
MVRNFECDDTARVRYDIIDFCALTMATHGDDGVFLMVITDCVYMGSMELCEIIGKYITTGDTIDPDLCGKRVHKMKVNTEDHPKCVKWFASQYSQLINKRTYVVNRALNSGHGNCVNILEDALNDHTISEYLDKNPYLNLSYM